MKKLLIICLAISLLLLAGCKVNVNVPAADPVGTQAPTDNQNPTDNVTEPNNNGGNEEIGGDKDEFETPIDVDDDYKENPSSDPTEPNPTEPGATTPVTEPTVTEPTDPSVSTEPTEPPTTTPATDPAGGNNENQGGKVNEDGSISLPMIPG